MIQNCWFRICSKNMFSFFYITRSWGLTKWLVYWLKPRTRMWTSFLLAPPFVFETRVFVDGHDAWVLGKECVDYLERGPSRRRSAVRVFLGSTMAPRSSNWRLQTTESCALSDHSHRLMLVYYLSSSKTIMQSFDIHFYSHLLILPQEGGGHICPPVTYLRISVQIHLWAL